MCIAEHEPYRIVYRKQVLDVCFKSVHYLIYYKNIYNNVNIFYMAVSTHLNNVKYVRIALRVEI